jgi:hypothetical protein
LGEYLDHASEDSRAMSPIFFWIKIKQNKRFLEKNGVM